MLEADEIRKAFAGQGGGARERDPEVAGDAKPGVAKTKVDDGSRPIHELMPDRRWVNWIEPSRFDANRAYLVFDAHRSDDDNAYVFVTENAGATWRSIVSNLPASAGTTRVLSEDLKNADVLYLGTELGAWVSIDRGASWTKLGTLPTVAVHALAQHPTSGEIVAATHGRSLWVMDVSALRQMNKKVVSEGVHLFAPNVAIQWRPQPALGAARAFVGQNPSAGAQIVYSLAKKTEGVSLKITSLEGKVLRELEASGDPGLHVVGWDLRKARPAGRQGRFRQGQRVAPDTYRVVLEAAGATSTQDVEVRIDPGFPDERWIAHVNAQEAEDAERAIAKSPEGDD